MKFLEKRLDNLYYSIFINTIIPYIISFLGTICILALIFSDEVIPHKQFSNLENGTKIVLKNGYLATIINKEHSKYYIVNNSYLDVSQGYGIWKNKYETINVSDIYALNLGTTGNPSVR